MNGIGSAGLGIGGRGFSTIASSIGKSGFDSPDSRRRGKAGGRVPPKGLVMWCMGSANTLGGATWVGRAGGDKISTWLDASGNRNHMIQATAAKKPSINRREQGGKDAMRFAAAEFMLSQSSSACDFGTGQFDIYMIYKGSNVGGTKVVYSNASAANQTGFDLRRFANETFRGKLYNGGAKQTAATAALDNSEGYWFSRFHRKSDDAVELDYDCIDGTSGTKAVSGGSDHDISAGQFSLGAYTNGATGADMNVTEILIYNRDLSDTESASVKSYLSDKYGLGL
jgi:hypothetical protein